MPNISTPRIRNAELASRHFGISAFWKTEVSISATEDTHTQHNINPQQYHYHYNYDYNYKCIRWTLLNSPLGRSLLTKENRWRYGERI